jgi:DNA invertase Pin-like site-specific DNA recombinase
VPIQTLAFGSSFRSRDSTYVRKSPEHIATAKRMKADGHTGKDIANNFGVSRATLYRYLASERAA